ncbi:MAG: hypothetical protein IJ011_04945 [Clostridia bacterium]|nr:hypothetical protein [Clostridia bacterium]MBQ8849659.1 hypothetical protein [Clostridia bacterium]
MKILKDKSGVSYVLVCVIVLFASMLIYAGLEYNSVLSVVESQKQEVSFELDKVTAESARENIENGATISTEDIEQRAFSTLGFYDTSIQIKDGIGYSMSRPSFSVITGTDITITAEYELTVPFRLIDAEVIEITVPVRVTAKYYERN